MTRFRSIPTEVEAMQWDIDKGPGMPSPDGEDRAAHRRMTDSWTEGSASQIVAWVNANGGEARYEPEHIPIYTGCDCGNCDLGPGHAPRIAVHTVNGWSCAAPGHYIVMGDARFPVATAHGRWAHPYCRDFYPCDPETFERRWEPVLD